MMCFKNDDLTLRSNRFRKMTTFVLVQNDACLWAVL